MNAHAPIFTSGAQCYADYRPPYPQLLIDDLRARTVGERGERHVDWGCGTGELTLPLSPFFNRVVGIDRHREQVSTAQAKAWHEGIENIEWHVARAEEIELEAESCDLITVGGAFHWMDRELLAQRALQALKPGAALALAGGAAGGPVWKETTDWHRAAAEALDMHVDKQREERARAVSRAANRSVRGQSPRDILTAAGFRVERFEYPTDFSWRTDEVIGYLYTIAFANPFALAGRRESFERELRDRLADLNPEGVFHERLDFDLTIAYGP